MNGRFPFDHNARRQQQINAANGVRAALGLTPNMLDDAYYTNLQQQQQQHQQQQNQHTTMHLRALQDQLYDQHFRQEELRVIQDRLQPQHDFPDLQHQYAQSFQQLLLAEQLQRQRTPSFSPNMQRAYEQQLLRQQLLQRREAPASPPETYHAIQQNVAVLGALGAAAGMTPPSSMAASPQMASPQMASPQTAATTKRKATMPPRGNPNRKKPGRKPKSKKLEKSEQTPTQFLPTDNSEDDDALGVLAGAAGLITHHDGIMSSIAQLTAAAQEVDDVDKIATDLSTAFANVMPQDIEDEKEEANDDKEEEDMVIDTPFFHSEIPEWPVATTSRRDSWDAPPRRGLEYVSVTAKPPAQANGTKPAMEDVSVDPWWPSVEAMKRERHNAGINSDEDDFPDTTTKEIPFRVNEAEVRNRLLNQMEPGVLEKLPHCRIHFLNATQNKHGAFSELKFCVQVTELYPNDTMVHCTLCGTWRHTRCGGRCTPSTGATDRDQRLSTICDFCYAEASYIEESPIGAERLERQRMEHARRSLATSAVIRHFSNSKNGGTYKWPLGSVSTAHISGHIRSVHVRHEKAEKQWSDMTARLARSLGFRARDRVKNRQKEFERLLSSIEDAEAFTDRHNMYIFLARDAVKDVPAGFESEDRNIFDPADDEDVAEMPFSLYNGDQSGDNECERHGCHKLQRFDSRFCSDACGVACIELDLLRTLEDAGEVHPSFLRTIV